MNAKFAIDRMMVSSDNLEEVIESYLSSEEGTMLPSLQVGDCVRHLGELGTVRAIHLFEDVSADVLLVSGRTITVPVVELDFSWK